METTSENDKNISGSLLVFASRDLSLTKTGEKKQIQQQA